MFEPYVIVGPDGVMYIGLHSNDKEAWRIYLGWPTVQEVNWYKDRGYYCLALKPRLSLVLKLL